MSTVPTPNFDTKPKSFWKRPEGVTGALVLGGIVLGGGYLLLNFLPTLIALASNTIYLAGMLLVLAAIVYMVLDPKMRALVGYMYKSIIRWITGLFVTIDPIGILKNYVDDLEKNLKKMSRQIGDLRGQMRKLKTIVSENNKEIEKSILFARKAKEQGNEQQLVLHTRKAARTKETNEKYKNMIGKIEVLHKILTRMHQNSEILLEDTRDQVKLKEQERKALRTSYSAMRSAMSVIKGDSDKRAMFDQALEAIADDVAMKVGEMEQFMDLSENFMNSIDLQNAVFEEKGLQMLEEYEKKSRLLLLGSGEEEIKTSLPEGERIPRSDSQDIDQKDAYDSFFD